ncbi:hypothetical protein [Bacillus sp. FSL K6-3431]|uniref:hypothetical protein n=1 Tax=Bacillus sp. FSL K6-3431 TaxID=2921500 RepID=UPI0030FBED79
MLEFIELNNEGLEILEEWYKDKEVLNRLGGKLPLQRWFQYVQQNPNYFAWMVFEKNSPVGQIEVEIYSYNSASIGIMTNPP